MRKAQIETTSLMSGDVVSTFGGHRIFSHTENERTINCEIFGGWTAVTLIFTDGTRETADKDGYVSIIIPDQKVY